MRGTKTADASAKRYLCEWRSQPTDRRASTLSESARAHPALESGTTRLAGSDPPLPSRLDLLPLAAAEIINTVAGRLALSAERPNHTNDLVSLSLVATERIARPHGIMPSDATLRWVAEGMTGGRRAVRRWIGPVWVAVDLDGFASRIESSAATPCCQTNRLPQSVRGVLRCSTIRARGRTSMENPLGTDFLQRASWMQLAGITETSPLHHRTQARSDALGHPRDIVSSTTQSKRDRTLRQWEVRDALKVDEVSRRCVVHAERDRSGPRAFSRLGRSVRHSARRGESRRGICRSRNRR